MHKRIIVAVSALLYALTAVVVTIMTDVHDRSFPVRLGADSNLYLDTGRTGLSDADAFAHLAELSDRLDLGLVKVQPDLTGSQQGQVFVTLGSEHPRRSAIGWYGAAPAAPVRDSTALEHSFATGQYLTTSHSENLDRFTSSLTSAGFLVKRQDDTAGQTWAFVLKQGSFRTTLLAAAALMVSTALYWLSVRARGRALRVLGGVPAHRIQLQDLGAFVGAITLPAVPVVVVATGWVAWRHGHAFVPYYATTLGTLVGTLVVVTGVVAVAVSAASWPSTAALVNRQPAVHSLKRASGTFKAVTFVLLVATAGPAWLAYQDAAATAAQQAQWRSLSNQVALRYPAALGEAGFQRLVQKVGGVTQAAQRRGDVALSYAMTPDQLGGADFGGYESVALVSDTWLRLMQRAPSDAAARQTLHPLTTSDVPPAVRRSLEPNLQIWSRQGLPGSEVLDTLPVYAVGPSSSLPLAIGGGGDLIFPRSALVLVVPDAHATFNDDFLASLSSSNNLVFAGLEPTLSLLAEHGLQHTISVKLVAEDGVLQAQFAEYQAWLRALSMVILLTAFALSAAISAFIAAMLASRRDFPMRLAGIPWTTIVRARVAREWAVGAALAALVVLLQPLQSWAAALAAGLLALLVTPVSHVVAARWCFVTTSARRI